MAPTKTPERVKDLRTQLQTKADEIEQLSASWNDETGQGHFTISTKAAADYRKTVNDAQEIRELLATEEKAAGIFTYLASPDGTPVAGTDAAAAARAGLQVKDLGSSFLDSEAYQEMKASNFKQISGIYTQEAGLPAIAAAARLTEVKDIYSDMAGNLPAMPVLGAAQNVGFTERMLRPGRVRDLFASERTSAAMLYGVRETGFTNRAAVVPERTAADGGPATGGPTDIYGLKPRSDLSLVPYSAPIATIAHIMYAHRNALADAPMLQGLINRNGVDGLKMTEDEQLLYGNGQGDNIRGLVNQPGIQLYDGLTAEKRTAQIRRSITRAVLAWFQPTGVVMHPLDWEDVELETDLNGAYTVATSVALGGVKQVWRLSVIDTPAMHEGRFLVGSFGTGARIYDREETSVAVSTENRDLFERNAVTFRFEERLGMLVDRPESFVYGKFDAA